MKKLLLLIFVIFFSCSNSSEDENNSNTPSGTFLTINGDTREIVHNGDSELRITKEVVYNPIWIDMVGNFEAINLDITDPNHSLIANWGDYTYGYYLILRFYLPSNFSAGTYTLTSNSNDALAQNQSFSYFLALTEFIKTIKDGQTFEIKEEGNKWIVEFKNLEYVGDGSTAIISGRIILNK